MVIRLISSKRLQLWYMDTVQSKVKSSVTVDSGYFNKHMHLQVWAVRKYALNKQCALMKNKKKGFITLPISTTPLFKAYQVCPWWKVLLKDTISRKKSGNKGLENYWKCREKESTLQNKLCTILELVRHHLGTIQHWLPPQWVQRSLLVAIDSSITELVDQKIA